MGVLTVVLDLRCTGKPVTESKNWLSWAAQIPAVYIAIYSACGYHVWVVSREVDIRNGSRMAMERMFNCHLRSVLVHIQVPYQRFLVRCTGNPVVPCCEWRPLHIRHKPGKPMSKMTRRVEGRVEVNNVESFGALIPVSRALVEVPGMRTTQERHLDLREKCSQIQPCDQHEWKSRTRMWCYHRPT